MYSEHFGLNQLPFSIAPNPRFLYMSLQHREALAHLLYGLAGGAGFVQLTGEVGTGKTTLCRSLVERLPARIDVALILNPRLSAQELVAAICDELQVEYPAGNASIKVLTDALNAFLLRNHGARRHTVLIIDEAQGLSVDVLEQLRLLTNLETTQVKLLQVILVGQPELRDQLARDDMRQLAQRITARYHLVPMTREQTAAYVRHRLTVCGATRDIFDNRAINRVYQLTGGVPRLVNVLCDRAMLGAFVEGKQTVDTRIVDKAAAEVLPRSSRPSRPAHFWPPAIAALTLLAAALGVAVWAALYQGHWPTWLQAPGPQPVPAPLTAGPDPTPPDPAPAGTGADAADPVPTPVAPAATEPGEQATVPSPPAGETAPAETRPADVVTEAADSTGEPPDDPSSAAQHDDPRPPETDPARVGTPADDRPDLASLLQDGEAAWSSQAWPALYRLWGYESAATTDAQACAQASSAGLACIQASGNWGAVLRLNRPALLLLNGGDGRPVPVLLLGVDGDAAVVQFGPQTLSVPVSELERHWMGGYRILWRKPPGGVPVLRPGQRSNDVRWLREKLARVTGVAGTAGEPTYYDDALAERVREFQRTQGLLPDGIAGARTLIALNNADPAAEGPRLVRSMGTTGG